MKSEKVKTERMRTKSDEANLDPLSPEFDEGLIKYKETADIVADAKQIIDSGRNAAYQSVNAAMISTYWNLGKRIVVEEQRGQKRAKYGAKIIQQLSEKLTAFYGKGFTSRALRQYRQFYLTFMDIEKWNACVPFLTWTHLRSLLRVNNPEAREWYLQETVSQTWSSRTLDRNISTQYYERLLMSQHKESVESEMKTTPYQADKLEFIKNPVVAEFMGLSSNIDFSETELEQAIISHLQKFLMELGKGYAFVARQQHIRTELDDYYIDLVFYNYILKCFVMIDLKTTKITHQDVGQMDMYIRMYDELKRGSDDNPRWVSSSAQRQMRILQNIPYYMDTSSFLQANISCICRVKKSCGLK